MAEEQLAAQLEKERLEAEAKAKREEESVWSLSGELEEDEKARVIRAYVLVQSRSGHARSRGAACWPEKQRKMLISKGIQGSETRWHRRA